MPSFRTVFLSAVVALSSVVSADYVIDPSSVSLRTREYWCQGQTSTCPILCQQVKPGTTLVNTCDPEALTYGCLCGNNLQPNMSEYTLTLPYYVCTAWVQQCQSDCGDHNNKCISSCVQDHPCGATNPIRTNASSSTAANAAASATATGDDNQIFDGPSGGSSDDDSAAAVLDIGRRFGLGVVIAGLAVGFGMLA
jgi:hypothetical protein